MMSDFGESLKKAIESEPSRRAKAQRLLEFLKRRRRAKDRALARLERHASAALDIPDGVIDWSKVDWSQVFWFILKVLLAILPLLLAQEGQDGNRVMEANGGEVLRLDK